MGWRNGNDRRYNDYFFDPPPTPNNDTPHDGTGGSGDGRGVFSALNGKKIVTTAPHLVRGSNTAEVVFKSMVIGDVTGAIYGGYTGSVSGEILGGWATFGASGVPGALAGSAIVGTFGAMGGKGCGNCVCMQSIRCIRRLIGEEQWFRYVLEKNPSATSC